MVNWSIPDDLAASYDRCRGINRDAGSTFYWAARLLPRRKRPHVHALYALARLADDIVDEQPVEHRATRLTTFAQSFFADLERVGRSTRCWARW